MDKILIVGFSKLEYMPYLKLYKEALENEHGVSVDLLVWDRDGGKKNSSNDDIRPFKGLYRFREELDDDKRKIEKVKPFLKFRKYLLSVLKSGDYNKLILMHTFPALLICDVLFFKYKKKYIFDFRDVTYEKNPLFRFLIKTIAKMSYQTFLSSKEFSKFFSGVKNISIVHNASVKELREKKRASVKTDPQRTPIKIGFWGFIRHLDVNLKIIQSLANDKRFELHYFGKKNDVQEQLKKYIQSKEIRNIYFHGEYEHQKRADFIVGVDLIHNVYRNDVTKYAMGNKFYDGILFGKPQICSKGSVMGNVVENMNIGMVVDVLDEYEQRKMADKIYEYYSVLDKRIFLDNCDKVRERVVEEMQESLNKIRLFVLN